MKTLTVFALMALAGLGTAQAQDPTFKTQLDALAAQVQYQQAALDAEARALAAKPLDAPAVALQTPQDAAPRKLDPVEAEALRAALERGARCVTGKLVKDPDSPLWVPEMKPGCLK